MRVRVGTSGYAYKEWKGFFYPPELPADGMLRFYAGQLETVEINNTFYRMPTPQLLEGWAAQVPADFSFVLKAPRRITHVKRLKNVREDTLHLLRTAATLGPRLGPILFQLPPFLKKDASLLREFAASLPDGFKAAIEFRNDSWRDAEVDAILSDSGIALVVSDAERHDPPVVPTARFGYLRLRRESYDEAALATWAGTVRSQPWEAAHVFFKHEDEGAGPRLAAAFQRLVAG
jgi:uncharacterized protein YecE (DUF72 family)